jgi:aldehyde:ferredoxin oxidoreductase
MTTTEKVAKLREFREEQYKCLTDAVYKRREWTRNGVPTLEKVKALGIDFPDVVEIVNKYESIDPSSEILPESDEAWA